MRYFRPLLYVATFIYAASMFAQSRVDLEQGFVNPPEAAKPLTWWHWINGNVSREGILADLRDMKRVGLAGAQMIDVSMYIPQGTARYGSEEWNGDIQYAIRTAHELGLSFGMMNGPGWSGSGGPWVTPELAMQHVVWSETAVDGGHRVQMQLPRPSTMLAFYRDIAVIAVPADALEPSIELMPPQHNADVAKADQDTSGSASTAVLRYPHSVERRTIELQFKQPHEQGIFSGSIEASQDGVQFRLLRSFSLRGQLGEPSLLIAFPPTSASTFRVQLAAGAPALDSMELDDRDRIENYLSKSVSAVVQPVLDTARINSIDRAAIPLDKVIPLNAMMAQDGSMDWTAPPGRWTILRFGYTPTGSKNHPAQDQGTGLEIDKMSAAAADFYFEHSLGRILHDAGPLAGKTFNSVVIDSWESGQQNWTPGFQQFFLAHRGYDLVGYLPTLTGRVVTSPLASETFLRDFRRTVSDMVAQNYYGEFRRLSEAHHLALYAETYDGVAFNQAISAAQPSVTMAEFWAPHGAIDDERVKSMASAAHLLGRNMVAAEAFTGQPEQAKWLWTPETLKPIGDIAFADGVNRFVLHSYVHQPLPGIAPGFTLSRFGTHFGRLSTWWPLAKPWLQYTARCSFLLQQGSPVADVLVLHSDEMDSLQDETAPALPAGHSYDWITLQTLATATAYAGEIVLPLAGPYRVLVLPAAWTASVDLLRHLRDVVQAGVPVLGTPPIAPSTMQDLRDMQTWQALVTELWPSAKQAASTASVLPPEAMPALFASHLKPDVKLVAAEGFASLSPIVWTHRRDGDTDIYFLANTSDTGLAFFAEFGSGHKQPELWDPVSGKHMDSPVMHRTAQGVEVPLHMASGSSIFVILRKPLPRFWIDSVMDDRAHRAMPLDANSQSVDLSHSGSYSIHRSDGTTQAIQIKLPPSVDLGRDWAVHFRPPIGMSFDRTFATLHDFAADNDGKVRYFSGVATYRRTVVVTREQIAGHRCLLELGDVQNIATVTLNGHALGVLWAAPFAVDVKPWLHEGNNTIEIAVTDRWTNRMIGDELLPADAVYAMDGGPMYSGRLAKFPVWFGDPAKTALRQRTSFATWHYFSATSPLVSAGLLGPVKLVFYRQLLSSPNVH
jgi:hypothetical protein